MIIQNDLYIPIMWAEAALGIRKRDTRWRGCSHVVVIHHYNHQYIYNVTITPQSKGSGTLSQPISLPISNAPSPLISSTTTILI